MKEQEFISIPVEWLSELVRLSKVAEKNKEQLIHLFGYLSSAETLLKYANRKKR